jgi:hypothetical protein
MAALNNRSMTHNSGGMSSAASRRGELCQGLRRKPRFAGAFLATAFFGAVFFGAAFFADAGSVTAVEPKGRRLSYPLLYLAPALRLARLLNVNGCLA